MVLRLVPARRRFASKICAGERFSLEISDPRSTIKFLQPWTKASG